MDPPEHTPRLDADDLVDVVRRLSRARTVDEVERVVAVAARRLVGADDARLLCGAAARDGIAGWVSEHGRPAVVTDVLGDERTVGGPRPTATTRALVMVPVRGDDPVGVIGVCWGRPRRADRREVELLQALADSTSAALEAVRLHQELERRVEERTAALQAINARLVAEVAERRRAEQEVRRLSLTDDLTGVRNLRGFLRHGRRALGNALVAGAHPALVFVDVDGLKRINDERGHEAGSAVLVAVARTLEDVVRADDVVGRLGGDEFAVLLPDAGDAERVADRVRAELEERGIAASLGLARHRDGMDLALLVNAADAAMYEDKRRRRGAAKVG